MPDRSGDDDFNSGDDDYYCADDLWLLEVEKELRGLVFPNIIELITLLLLALYLRKFKSSIS